MSTRLTARVVPKASDYTIVYPMDAPGTIFTNKGAQGAVVFTLPTPGDQLIGCYFDFLVVVGQNVTVKTAGVDTAIAFNDLTADSLAFSTGGALIGALLRAICVQSAAGYSWVLVNLSTANAATVNT